MAEDVRKDIPIEDGNAEAEDLDKKEPVQEEPEAESPENEAAESPEKEAAGSESPEEKAAKEAEAAKEAAKQESERYLRLLADIVRMELLVFLNNFCGTALRKFRILLRILGNLKAGIICHIVL